MARGCAAQQGAAPGRAGAAGRGGVGGVGMLRALIEAHIERGRVTFACRATTIADLQLAYARSFTFSKAVALVNVGADAKPSARCAHICARSSVKV